MRGFGDSEQRDDRAGDGEDREASPAPRLPADELHQPPDPVDLRLDPPANATCARIRGLMRDAADGDLTPAHMAAVALHVHECRKCSVALSRAEFEVFRLREAMAAIPRPRVPVGFARRTTERLVREIESATDTGSGGSGSGGRSASAAGRDADGAAADSRRRRVTWHTLLWAGAASLAVMVVALVCVQWNVEVKRTVRIVVQSGQDCWREVGQIRRRLGPGEGFGSGSGLVVGRRGEAQVEWHDAMDLRQPVAEMSLGSETQVRVGGDSPLLVNGTVEVDSHRQMRFDLADGSSLELGTGQYRIDASLLAETDPPGVLSEAALRVRLEVLSGEPAIIVRRDQVAVSILMGQEGLYAGSNPVAVHVPDRGGLSGGGTIREVEPPAPVRGPGAIGQVLERPGGVAVGAQVLLTFTENGRPGWFGATTGGDGMFTMPPGRRIDGDYAIVTVLPDRSRPDLGIVAPNARWVRPLGNGASGTQLVETLQVEPSPPVSGEVWSTDNLPVPGASVYACVVDSLFGYLTPCPGLVALTAPDGSFTLRGLPVSLGAHLYLALLVLHPYHQPGFHPIALPGSAGFGSQNRMVRLQWIREARFVDMPPNQRIEIWEEAFGTPPGTVIRSYWVDIDSQGRQRGTPKVGNGRLWQHQVAGGQGQLRELTRMLASNGDPPTFRPVGDWGDQQRYVRDIVPVSSDFLVARDFRHQRFTHSTGPWMFSVQDRSTGQPVPGVQLFAVAGGPTRGPVSARFLGLYNAGLPLPSTFERDEFELVAVATDGSLAVMPLDSHAPPTHVWLRAEGPGTVGLGPGSPWLPGDGSTVTLRFHGTAPNALVRPTLVCFASSESGWEAGGLPAGSYRLEAGSRSMAVQVRARTLNVVR
jgi:hypothetical protein